MPRARWRRRTRCRMAARSLFPCCRSRQGRGGGDRARIRRAGVQGGLTKGTAKILAEHGVPVEPVHKLAEGRPNILDAIKNGEINFVVNTPSSQETRADERKIRAAAIQYRHIALHQSGGGPCDRAGHPCLADPPAGSEVPSGMARLSRAGCSPRESSGWLAAAAMIISLSNNKLSMIVRLADNTWRRQQYRGWQIVWVWAEREWMGRGAYFLRLRWAISRSTSRCMAFFLRSWRWSVKLLPRATPSSTLTRWSLK